MQMTRQVGPELLDQLPPDDPQALGSRRDLQRINLLMGNARILSRTIQALASAGAVRRVVELGAGDGTFMWRLAAQLSARCQSVEVLLVDRQKTVAQETLEAFRRLGWNAVFVQSDVLAWLSVARRDEIDLIVANLFLHHFPEDALRTLLQLAFARTKCFVACEPRRCVTALLASRLLGLIGCNGVTRHDASVSVRAGFAGRELSNLCPGAAGWQLQERRAALFSHCFAAQRFIP